MDTYLRIFEAILMLAVPFLYHELLKIRNMERECQIKLASIETKVENMEDEARTNRRQNGKFLRLILNRINGVSPKKEGEA